MNQERNLIEESKWHEILKEELDKNDNEKLPSEDEDYEHINLL